MGKLDEVRLKLDSKGRLYIPRRIREQIGDTVILRKTDEGLLIARGRPSSFSDEFLRIITSKAS